MSPKSRSILLQVLSWIVMLSPAWVLLAHLPSFGELQGNDYYGIVDRITDEAELSHDPMRWLNLKSNEHRVTVPVLIYVANMSLTRGSNYGLTVFALSMLAWTVVMLVRLLPADLRAVSWVRIALGFTVTGFCFTPVAAHSVAMGFSGTIWFLANALSVAAIVALVRCAGRREIWGLWPILLLGFLAAFSHSTHLILWPVLLLGGLCLRIRRRGLILLAAATTLVFSLFILTYEPFAKHPAPNTSDVTDLLRYISVYLGALFSPDLATARAMGLIGLLAAAIVAWLALLSGVSRPSRRDLIPWLMILTYGLGNAVMTAVSRSGNGEHQAAASRYASLAALFWVGLLISASILAWRHRPVTRRGQILLAVASVMAWMTLAIGMHQRGNQELERFVSRGQRQRVASLALSLDIRDDDILRRAVTPAAGQVWAIYDFLKASDQVPFDTNPRWRVGEQLAPSLLSKRPHDLIRGELDRMVELPGGYVRPGGWAFGLETEVAEILVLDAKGRVQGEIFTEIRRPELKKRVHEDAALAGWEGYARVDPQGGELQAYVRVVGDPMLYPLPTRQKIARQMRWGTDSSEGS